MGMTVTHLLHREIANVNTVATYYPIATNNILPTIVCFNLSDIKLKTPWLKFL